jgi:hypothetical protein
MTAIPIELYEAREVAATAWEYHAAAVERNASILHIDTMHSVAQKCEAIANEWYARWQKLGGTSDIGSILDAEAKQRAAMVAEAADYMDLKRTQEDARL